MIGQEFKIIFKQNKAYLSAGHPLTLNQIGLPEFAQTFNADAYWTFRILNYLEEEEKLFCEVLLYNVGHTDFPDNQKRFTNELKAIKKLLFAALIQLVF